MNTKIKSIVDWFEAHPEIGIAGFLLGLVIGIWSLIVALKSKNIKKLAYSFNGHNLIQDFSEKLNGLEVKFNNENVKNLSVTKIAIWNSGNLTLHKSDIVLADPIRIVANDDVSILDFQILQTNEASNQFTLAARESINNPIKTLEIDFDYFDPNQGCVIQILHNGSSFRDLTIPGKLKGINNFKKYDSSRIIYRFGEMIEITKSKRYNRIIVGIIFITLSLILGGAIYFLSSDKVVAADKVFSKYFMPFAVLPYLYIGFRLIISRLPKGLDSFDERL